jgi:hypothetical protein
MVPFPAPHESAHRQLAGQVSMAVIGGSADLLFPPDALGHGFRHRSYPAGAWRSQGLVHGAEYFPLIRVRHL